MITFFIGMIAITCFFYIVAGALVGGMILIGLIVSGIIGICKLIKSTF